MIREGWTAALGGLFGAWMLVTVVVGRPAQLTLGRTIAEVKRGSKPDVLVTGGGRPAGAQLSGGVQRSVRCIPPARPLPAMTSAILRLASSIISSPIMAAPRLPPASDVYHS